MYGPVVVTGYVISVMMQIDREQHPALRTLRQDIVNCFSDIACFLMPHPGLAATTSEHFQGQLAGIVHLVAEKRDVTVVSLGRFFHNFCIIGSMNKHSIIIYNILT